MWLQMKSFCCGCQSVESGSRTVSFVQIAVGAVYAALSIYNEMVQGIVGGVVLLALGLVLYYAVRNANVPILIFWLLACMLAIVWQIFEFVVYLSAVAGADSTNTAYEPDGYFIQTLVSVVVIGSVLGFHLYSLLVVFSFVRELQGHGGMPIFPR